MDDDDKEFDPDDVVWAQKKQKLAGAKIWRLMDRTDRVGTYLLSAKWDLPVLRLVLSFQLGDWLLG